MLDPQNYQLSFKHSPVGGYLLSPTLEILDVNDSFLRVTARTREELLGLNLFDAFPADPGEPPASGGEESSVTALRRSLARVLHSLKPDALPLQRYPISLPTPEGGRRFEERYWSAVSTPILDARGTLLCIAHSTIDVTEMVAGREGLTPGARLVAGVVLRARSLQEVHEALRDERARLRHLFEHAPGFVYFTSGPQHVIEEANNAFRELLGAAGELTGQALGQLFPEPDGQGVMGPHDEVLATGRPFISHAHPVRLVGADGVAALRWLDLVFQPIFDEEGSVSGVCGQGVDVSEKLRVEAELRAAAERRSFQLELADRIRDLDSVEQVCATTSQMLGHNLEAARVLLADVDEVAGVIYAPGDWVDLRRGLASLTGRRIALANFGAPVLQALREGGVLRVDDVYLHPLTAPHAAAYDAHGVRAWLSVPLVKAGRLSAVLSVHSDTPRAWTAGEMNKCRNTAERAWAALERARAQAQLRDANQRKDEFLAMLAHELRNPLAPISTAAQLLERGTLTPEQLRRTSQVIGRQVLHMTGLVDDLLDVSRVTRGLIRLERLPQDMDAVVAAAVEQVRPLIEAQRHRIDVSLPPHPVQVMGDSKRLVQVVANLLNNAAKYTPPGGHLWLDVGADERDVRVSVQDDGIGMPAELQLRVFELFAQAQRNSDRSQGGLGLGLALVKSLVELHGGRVSCHSEGPDEGSRFEFVLPRLCTGPASAVDGDDGPGAERAAADPAAEVPPGGLRVLVVDDNTDAAEMLAELLQAEGYHVAVEHRGQAALARARREPQDVGLLDIGLPDMDGTELARRLRAQPDTAAMVLVAITGYGQEHDRHAALAAGFDRHMVKPVAPQALLDFLREIADQRAAAAA